MSISCDRGNMKKCTKCYIEFPETLEYFYWNGAKTKLASRCKQCVNDARREGQRTDKFKKWQKKYQKRASFKKYHKKYRATKEHKEAIRDYAYKNKFGITTDEYEIILQDQRGRCAVCGILPGERRLAVDHDHETGEIRGLLCVKCNAALGMADDNIEILKKLIDYLND